MTEVIQATAILAVYRLVTIGIGCLIVYFGFRLFMTGVFEKAGELKAVWGERNLTVRQASPGTFLVLFGAVVITASLWQGLAVSRSIRTESIPRQSGDDSLLSSGDSSKGTGSTVQATESTHITGLGGSSTRAPLSTQIRRELSEYAMCQLVALTELATQECLELLKGSLKMLPNREDVEALERAEGRLRSKPDSTASAVVQTIRQRYVK